MTFGWLRNARTLFLVMLFACVPALAHANGIHISSLDHRVDMLSSAQLLAQPATALVDHDRQVAAQRLARWLFPGWLISILVQVVALAWFWRSGTAAALRERLRRITGSELLVRFGFGATLALLARLAALVPELYIFRIDRMMGLSDQLLRAWTGEWIVNTLVAMALAGIVTALVLWLVDTTHQWYIYTAFGIVFASLCISFIGPYVLAPHGNAATLSAARGAQLLAMERTAHVPPVPVVVRHHTQIGSSTVQGLGPTLRIVLSDALVSSATADEFTYVAARQLGHIANNDPLRIALFNALFVILGLALAVFIADRIGFRRDDDPISRVALVAALIGCVYLLVVPIDNALARSMASRADQYALASTNDRVGAVRAIVRSTDQRLDAVCPTILSVLFLNRYPSAAQRVHEITGAAIDCP